MHGLLKNQFQSALTIIIAKVLPELPVYPVFNRKTTPNYHVQVYSPYHYCNNCA